MGLWIITSCSENPTVGNNVNTLKSIMKEGVPADQITWLNWKPEALTELSSRDNDACGTQTKLIKAHKKGKVGGGVTFHNKVKFLKNSMAEDQEITVTVLNVVGGQQAGAGVDFLPGQQFLRDVKVILSWAYLDYDEDEEFDFHVYYSEDDGNTWFEVEDPEINYNKQTVSVWVDHFTRYAWGF